LDWYWEMTRLYIMQQYIWQCTFCY
jgi:hypothetical protein